MDNKTKKDNRNIRLGIVIVIGLLLMLINYTVRFIIGNIEIQQTIYEQQIHLDRHEKEIEKIWEHIYEEQNTMIERK